MFSISAPKRGYDDLFAEVLAAVPSGTFYDDYQYPIISWKAAPINFTLNTDNFNVPVLISTLGNGDYHINVDTQNVRNGTTLVPNNGQTTFQITLKRGLNRIVATEQVPDGQTAYLDVIATTNAIIFESLSREMFVSIDQLNQQQAAIYSKFSTRLLDQVINFQDLLTGIEALKSMTTRLLIRGLVHFPAREIGIPNLIEAFALNTPAFIDSRDFKPFDIGQSRILRTTEIASGEEAHVWFPNLSVTRWLAFIRMADSLRQNYEVLDIRDNLVTIDYKGQTQRHRFDFNSQGSNFLTNLSFNDCFSNIEMSMSFSMNLNQTYCVWQYLFDEFVTADNPIGQSRVMFDEGIPFDSGLNFDQDSIDPFSDGWVGWSLDGRFEMDAGNTVNALYGLDTHVVPSHTYTGKTCVYDRGAYTQMMNTSNFEFDVDAEIEVLSGTWDDTYTQGAIVGLGMDIEEQGELTAGQEYLAAVKYVDANYMTNSAGTGLVTATEEGGGTSIQVGVTTNGHQYFYLTPTIAGDDQQWTLSDGTLTGISVARKVIAAPFDKFLISNIGPQQVNVPFSVTIQAADVYGNIVTDVGFNNVVQIASVIGFPADVVAPTSVTLTLGAATLNVTVTTTGSGALRFKLLPVQTDSNVFTVT